jgi:glycosyltransferase involved in cell wall biosynthesis
MSIVFFDPVCRAPYDTRTLTTQAIGGTESTVVRVADALEGLVVQHNRTETWGRYRPPAKDPGVTHVILAREARALPAVHALYPNARVLLWLHDRMRPGGKRARRLARSAQLLADLKVTVICVSDWQRQGVSATLAAIGVADKTQALTIYNPIDDRLAPDAAAIEPGKLVFFSSPNKGLSYTLDAFRFLKEQLPDLRLVVGNPGYKERRSAPIPGVEYLGAQPQERIHAQVRTALATFAPNFLIPETFGLVLAESRALGTPVLTHDVGAAREVLADPAQVLPVTPAQRLYETLVGGLSPGARAIPARVAARLGLFDAYLERLKAWRAGGRPVTGPDPRFRMAAVIERWRTLLAG